MSPTTITVDSREGAVVVVFGSPQTATGLTFLAIVVVLTAMVGGVFIALAVQLFKPAKHDAWLAALVLAIFAMQYVRFVAMILAEVRHQLSAGSEWVLSPQRLTWWRPTPFVRRKEYSVAKINKFRIDVRRRGMLGRRWVERTIRFDYEGRSVKFARCLSEREAHMLVNGPFHALLVAEQRS